MEWSLTTHPTRSLSFREAVFTANHLTDTDKQNSKGKYTNNLEFKYQQTT